MRKSEPSDNDCDATISTGMILFGVVLLVSTSCTSLLAFVKIDVLTNGGTQAISAPSIGTYVRSRT